MTRTMAIGDGDRDVPQALICALIHHPQTLQAILDTAGLPPHQVAMWARRVGAAPEIEKLAGWLSVGRQPGRYKPLLEVAASHLRAGDLLEALPVFRWAYHAWQASPGSDRNHCADGAKLLALWGVCLHCLDLPSEALKRWRHALTLVQDRDALVRLAREIERTGASEEYRVVLEEALRLELPGAAALRRRWQRISEVPVEVLPVAEAEDPQPQGSTGVAVLADVANLSLAGEDQYGAGRQLDYGRLLKETERHGRVHVRLAFVPDLPETLSVRRHLERAGFQVDLKRPKHSRGRIVANADTGLASYAVRWASDPRVGRVELWTGDGDFLRVRDAVGEAWPGVEVAFRSFEVGTATAIRRLEDAWEPIDFHHLQRSVPKEE